MGRKRPFEMHDVRLLELTERESSVMKVSELDEYTYRDSTLNIFRTFGQLNNIVISGGVVVVPEHSYANALISKATDLSADLILVPWSETGVLSEHHTLLPSNTADKFSPEAHSTFIINVLKSNADTNVGIFVNRNFSVPSPNSP